jgi:hypothetical protein
MVPVLSRGRDFVAPFLRQHVPSSDQEEEEEGGGGGGSDGAEQNE